MTLIKVDSEIGTKFVEAFSKTLTHIPVTKTTSNYSGDETLTDGDSTTVEAAFFLRNDSYVQSRPGLVITGDAIIVFKTTDSITFNDKIVYNEITYRVSSNRNDILTRYIGTTAMYKTAQLFINDDGI